MANYSKKNKITEQTKEDAVKIARGIQKPGQTKEQTKLVAQGIQKGVEQYKKNHSEKKRELDKKLKKASASRSLHEASTDNTVEPTTVKNNKLPWILLAISWIGFVAIYCYGQMI
jgi:hypothetical protein